MEGAWGPQAVVAAAAPAGLLTHQTLLLQTLRSLLPHFLQPQTDYPFCAAHPPSGVLQGAVVLVAVPVAAAYAHQLLLLLLLRGCLLPTLPGQAAAAAVAGACLGLCCCCRGCCCHCCPAYHCCRQLQGKAVCPALIRQHLLAALLLLLLQRPLPAPPVA